MIVPGRGNHHGHPAGYLQALSVPLRDLLPTLPGPDHGLILYI
jgi:hypothetical protein